jgi:hypothetical protein
VIRRVLLLLGAVVVSAAGLVACEPSGAYDVAFFGDVPYGSNDGARVDTMIRDINANGSIVFSTHLGDLGPAESATCTDAWVDRETARMDTFQRPLVYTPGDNEWRDCSNQLGRLSYLRSRIFRGTGTESRGQSPMALTSQASRGYPENARWSRGPVTFATAHVVGSRDNYGNQSEFAPRRQATVDWVVETFNQARDQGKEGIVLMAQADPNLDQEASDSGRIAYQSMFDTVTNQTAFFAGEVVFIHGDGHSFKNQRPIAGRSNLRRVQVEGDSKVSYVRIHVEPGAGQDLFTISRSQAY